MKETDLITVCSECHAAACLQGEFMCENARTAHTQQFTVAWLRKHGSGESEHYWKREIAEIEEPATGTGSEVDNGI